MSNIFYNDILPGTLAGIAQVAAGHPFDTVKVNLQINNDRYNGMTHCFREIVKQNGIRGLYRGALSPIYGAMAHNGGVFFSYGLSKRIVSSERPLSIFQTFLAGGLAATTISMVECPVDLLKCKMQVQNNGSNTRYSSISNTFKIITQTYGIRGLYQGYSATLIRNVPCFGMYFAGFEASSRYLNKYLHSSFSESLLVSFISGGVAGFSFWGLFYPLEIIKTRIQVDNVDKTNRMYKSYLDCFRKTIQKEGIRALWNGYLPTIIRAVPVNASIFLAFNYIKSLN